MTAPGRRRSGSAAPARHPASRPVEAGHRGHGREHAGQVVGDGHAGPHRRTVPFAGQVEQAAVGDAQPVEAGPAGVRAVLAEDADPHVDQSGVEGVGPEVPLLHGPGAEVLAHHVGVRGQPPEERLALRGAQVAGDTTPAPSLDGPEQGVVGLVLVGVDERPDGAHEVPAPRELDLDDVGTQLAEESGAERCGDAGPHIEHPDAVERAGGGWGGAGGDRFRSGLLRGQRPAGPLGRGRRRPPSSRSGSCAPPGPAPRWRCCASSGGP